MKVAVVLTARPSWAKLEPVCRALKAMPDIELQIICCASALLERYGKVVDVVRKDYEVAAEVWSTYEGANLLTSAKETGALLQSLVETLARVASDVVVICADRHEVLACAQAASYLHIPLVHLQGGERTGSIDDKVRDSITHLSDYHCVATKRSALRVYGLTGEMNRVTITGCPSIDVAKQARCTALVGCDELGGIGPYLDLTDRFVTVLHHPVTSQAQEFRSELECLAEALQLIGLAVVWGWPGQDAGSESGAKYLRELHEANPTRPWHFVRNLPPVRFLKLLTQTSVLLGNSSCGIRESSYLGTPVVNVGSRQQGRERAKNVIDVPCDSERIITAMIEQLAHGPYPSSALYGNGHAGQRIAEVIRGI